MQHPNAKISRLPLVLHHGLLGFGNVRVGRLKFSYYHRIDKALIDDGYPVLVTRVHPTASIERRARMLKQAILWKMRRHPDREKRIIVLGHSMGGLDARYMITHLGMADRVAALVTLCTPHRGSPFADWCLQNLGNRLAGLKLAAWIGLDIGALNDLTTPSCARFNEQTPDAPGVQYFSVTAARPWQRVAPLFYHSHRIVAAAEGDNDGLVSVASATWGEHLGTWPVDHLHAVNKRLVLELRNPIGDVTPRYLQMVRHVESRLGQTEPVAMSPTEA